MEKNEIKTMERVNMVNAELAAETVNEAVETAEAAVERIFLMDCRLRNIRKS